MLEYKPRTLCPLVVNSTFQKCLPTTPNTKIKKCILFQKEMGFPEDSRPIFFDEEQLNKYSSIVEFMLGQLKNVHNNQKTITPEEASYLYNNQVWPDDNNTLLKLLHLACAMDLLSPLNAKTSTLKFLKDIYPTLSTHDPNFADWEEEHEPKILKMIKEKKDGQEPADY